MKQQEEVKLTVGIGASAGGLAVLKEFVKSLPPKTGMAFIIIQHLDPTHKSLLGELLAKESSIPVNDAQDNQELQADHIYVIPPGAYLELDKRTIKLRPPTEARGSRRAIDHFFRSLAEHCKDRCAGIVLSGSGSDGTAGLRSIKAAGGLSLAQEPESAEHASMPLSALNAKVIDMAIPVSEMFEILKQYADHPLTMGDENKTLPLNLEDSLEEITAILKIHEDFNLRQYKPTTVQRRIIRRMSLTNVDNYKDYLDLLRSNSEERKLLTKDLLINVTDFFRDPEAFAILENDIIPNILDNVMQGEDIRIWVAGCASGEEAYSIAILFLEALEKRKLKNQLKIFATDVDDHAIAIARRGVYPASIIGEIPENYLERYFVEISNSHHQFRIKNYVRDTITFATQNVSFDPPFNHMHLISCRNLLIYLKKEVQEKVLSSFYYSLENKSYLFLGSSETIGGKKELFKPVSDKWRIYQKIPGRERKKILFDILRTDPTELNTNPKEENKPRKRSRKQQTISRTDSMRRSLLDAFLPPGVIVDKDGYILYNHGDWKKYMHIPTGEPRNEISQLVLPPLRSRLRSALYKVRKSREPLSFKCALPNEDEEKERRVVKVDIAPMTNPHLADENVMGIVFREAQRISKEHPIGLSRDDEIKANQSLEMELAETKEELQNTIEELETSTEELKASHEEALSTNEELQSANEELEASAEELRSLNEELSTVNYQLKEKITELQSANDDVENFFASTNVPTIFLNPDLEIQRYTPAAEQLLKMGPGDINRPIQSLGRELVDNDLLSECKQVLQNFQPISRELKTYDRKWFIRKVTPYRTEERRIEGVVLVFQDITEIKELSQRAASRERQQGVVAKMGLLALTGVEPEELMHQVVREVAHTLNVKYCKILKYQPEENNFFLMAGTGWREGLVGQAIVPGGQDSQAGYTLRSKDPIIVKRLKEEMRFNGPQILKDHNIVSGISVLLNHSNPPYGVLGVHTDEYCEFSQDDANFLVSVSNMLSTAIRTRKAQKSLAVSQERLNMAREAAKIGIHDHNIITNTVYWDQMIRKIWGVPNDLNPITYDIFMEGLHPEDREPTQKAIEAAIRGKNDGELTIQYRVINKIDQQLRWIEATAKTVFEEGKALRMVGTVQDITESVKVQQKLIQSEEKLRMAMDTNHFGAFEYYLQKEQTHWDELLLEIWGVRPDEEPSQKIFWEGVHPEDTKMVSEKLEAATQPDSKGYYHAEYRVINRQNKKVSWVEASGQTVFDNGKSYKMIGMIIDITNRKNLENSLYKAVRELQEADNKKNEFLSILGHELRNPLTPLKAGIEILENGTEDLTRLLPLMQRSVNTMAKLLDDLLDLNRVSINKINLDVQLVDLSNILKNAMASAKSMCEKKNQQLSSNIEKGSLLVNGDPTRLEQIFHNLIINSCKYTPNGGEINIEARRISNDIQVKITDDGIGLEPEVLDKIFDPFFQVKPENKAASGLGIGLALSQKLVELHNGTIHAFSKGKNQGSTFMVVLPARRKKLKATNRDDLDQPVEIRPNIRLVLIEDNEDILTTVPLLLAPLQCDIKTANEGEKGLEIVKEFQPEVVLVDIGLPGISGYEVADTLRENNFKGMLVAMSGYSHKEAKEKSIEAGFDYHIAKPPSRKDIVTILAKVN